MKHLITAMLAAMLFITGCPAPNDNVVSVDVLNGNLAAPAQSYSLLSAFTAALPCAGQSLVWGITESSNIGWNTAVDGSITQSGLWTSPSCGSTYLGLQMHVTGKCVSTGQTATATVATVPESVSTVAISHAVVTNIGQAACSAANPLAPTVQPGGTIQFYSTIVTTCGSVVTPTPPATWPANCP